MRPGSVVTLAVAILIFLPAVPSGSLHADWKDVSATDLGTAGPLGLAAKLKVQEVGPSPRMLVSVNSSLPWLYAQGDLLAGPGGAYVPLRGVDLTGFTQYNLDWNESIPLTLRDFVEMHELGLDFVRMPLSWSLLEPAPGVFNATYFAAVQQAVGWAGDEGIYVLLDMHQDLYNRFLVPPGIEADGAPDWATLAGNASRTCPVVGGTLVCQTGPAVEAAWNAFWNNTTVPGYVGLWEAYGEGLRTLASAFADVPNVLGYDIMNEPATGTPTSSLGPGFCPNGTFVAEYQFEDCYLLPFYQDMIHWIRSVDPRHAIFVEPSVYQDGLNWAPWNPFPLGDRNVVYEPHIYTDVFTLGANWSGNTSSLVSAYNNAVLNAQEFGNVPWFVGEYGISPGAYNDTWIEANINLAGLYGVGNGLWEWKTNVTQPTETEPGGSWGLVNPNGSLRHDTARAEILASPHTLAAGMLQVDNQTLNFSSGNFTARLRSLSAGSWARLYISSFLYPGGYSVTGTFSAYAESNSSVALPGGTVFETSLLNVTFPSGGTQWLNITRAPNEGWLEGQVTPSYANVTVNGKVVPVVRGNFTLAVPAGNSTVSASAPGWLPATQEVSVAAGRTSNLAIQLVPAPARLVGSVNPPSAQVSLDSVSLPVGSNGSFSWTGPPGMHILNVTDGGYLSRSLPLDLSAGMVRYLNLTLVPALLSVTLSPSSAKVSLQGVAEFTAIPVCTAGGCPSGAAYFWSLAGPPPGQLNTSTGGSVTFTAGKIPGTVTLFVNVTLDGVTRGSSAQIILSPSRNSGSPGPAGLSFWDITWLAGPIVGVVVVTASLLVARRKKRGPGPKRTGESRSLQEPGERAPGHAALDPPVLDD